MFWDATPECNMEASRSIEPFHSRLCNKNENRAWRMDLGDISYGLGTYYNNCVIRTILFQIFTR